MHHMKNIINHDYDGLISLPKSMYHIRNVMQSKEENNISINIKQQVTKFLKIPNVQMTELEERQDLLLKKLDILYDRIKIISSYCKVNVLELKQPQIKKTNTNVPGEIVLVVSPDNLPLFLDILLQKSSIHLNIKWHVHSSVPNEKITKIMTFVKNLHASDSTGTVLRLIFKCVSADSEMKLSSLEVPIVGNVNILRYLSYIYPDVLLYNQEDFKMDGFMDLCHLLERSPEKNKEALLNKLFSQCLDIWICNNQFSIVDLAAYNVIKQWKNIPKTVPKKWLENCSKFGK